MDKFKEILEKEKEIEEIFNEENSENSEENWFNYHCLSKQQIKEIQEISKNLYPEIFN